MRVNDYTKRKTNKYNAIKTEFNGIMFDSKKEAIRYSQLNLLQRAKKISDLQLQVKYDFVINGVKIGFYKADFVYIENGVRIIEDSKGVRTPVYKIKKKLMKAIHDIDIFET